jgi:hypothetical protein
VCNNNKKKTGAAAASEPNTGTAESGCSKVARLT